MGIVLKQSLKNTLVTYMGFALGALNVLFLYTHFMTDAYFGLVSFILATSALLMPLMAFGVPNTFIKYYSGYSNAEDKESFSTVMLFLPLLLILPLGAITYLAYETIAVFLSRKNELVKDYVWYIFLIALAMGYFEVFYAWSKVHMKSVFGNFMKEVFIRICVTILLLLLHFNVITVSVFLKALVGAYLLRTIIMKLYAYKVKWPKLNFNFPENIKEVLIYSSLIILGASASVMVLEIDRFMINQFIKIENVAYYSVAIFIATVIIVPSRAMHQITYPLTAELLNKNDSIALKELYKKSSLTLFIISGLVFILILLGLNDLYALLPLEYRGGYMVVLLIGLAKLYDSVLGNNNAILYNSKYYKTVLVFGVCLAITAVLLNIWLIPAMGIEGAAWATFIAICIFNSLKLFYVWLKFKIIPFTWATLKILLIQILLFIAFSYLELGLHPVLNIAIGSVLVSGIYLIVLYKFKISEDVSGVLNKFMKR